MHDRTNHTRLAEQHAAPTKADPLHERMLHAFGRDRVRSEIEMLFNGVADDPLWHLTEEAKDLLLHRLMRKHRSQRRFAAESRKHHQRRA